MKNRIYYLCSCIIEFIKLIAKKGTKWLALPHIWSLFLNSFYIFWSSVWPKNFCKLGSSYWETGYSVKRFPENKCKAMTASFGWYWHVPWLFKHSTRKVFFIEKWWLISYILWKYLFLCSGQNKKIPLFRAARPYLIFFQVSWKYIIWCILKGKMPFKMHKIIFFQKKKKLIKK